VGSRARIRAEPVVTEVRLTHIGGPTVLLEIAGWRILTDPTFDPPGGRYRFGWGTGSRKLAGPAVSAEDIGPIDVILLTHDHHGDNLDHAGRALLDQAGEVVTTASGAKRLGRGRWLEPWTTTALEASGRARIDVTATPCRHGPPLSRPLAGEVIGFALRVEEDGDDGVIWISGDTVLYPGVREVADRLDVAVALLHLGGVQFPVTGPLRYSMTARDAVELCALLDPRMVVPIHYEGWKHFSEGRESIEAELASAPPDIRERFRWLEIGTPTVLDAAETRPDISTAHV
jgi:L-ascorbate metabolism protein UlaG (beta-lactamase superfamily)